IFVGLRHEAHPLRHAVLRAELGDVLAVEPDMAAAEPEHAEDGLHRGGLAGAVRTDDHGDLALFHRQRAVVQDVGRAVAAGHALGREEGAAGGGDDTPAGLRIVDGPATGLDWKSTRLNSSHVKISYAVFCLTKK